MERPALFVGDADGEETLSEKEVRERMNQGLPPESAEEYLLRVRIESKELPSVVEAQIPDALKKQQTPYMPSTEPVSECPPNLLPSGEWERQVISTFVDLRQYLRHWKAVGATKLADRQPVPALKDGAGWHIFCLGYVDDEDIAEAGVRARARATEKFGRDSAQFGSAVPGVPGSGVVAVSGRSSVRSSFTMDPTTDDDAQSTYCVVPVESLSTFDRFSETLASASDEAIGKLEAPKELENVEEKAQDSEKVPGMPIPKDETAVPAPTPASASASATASTPATAPATAATTVTALTETEEPTEKAGEGAHDGLEEEEHEREHEGKDGEEKEGHAQGQGHEQGEGESKKDLEGNGEGSKQESTSDASKRPYGKEWLKTHPQGTAPTLRLAMQFDQVLTQKVLAFHAEWLKTNLLSRARAVWIYTLLACLEKPLGSETAAIVREVLRRCCAQRTQLESPQDENLPALNVIAVLAGTYFQQAEVL